MLGISPSSTSEEKNVESFRGSFVSVISNDDIQYKGLLHHINLQESTLCIKNVTCYRTEDMQRDEPNIQPQINNNYRSQLPLFNEAYDQMVFRGSDIKDLKILSQPKQCIDFVVGHFVSVITTEHVRVEGILTHYNLHDKTLIMKNAYCYGSEGRRRRRRSEIRSCNQLSVPVNFRFKDIMDFEVIFLPQPQVEDCGSEFPPITRSHIGHRIRGL